MSILTEFDSFIDGLRSDVINRIFNSDLPLVGTELQSAATPALAFLDTLKSSLHAALNGVSNDATAIADAINAAGLAGVTAAVDSSNSNKVNLVFSQDATVNVPLASGGLDFGGTGFGLDADADFAAVIKPALNATVSFDTASGALSLVDTAGDELTVDIGVAVDVSNGSGGPASGDLGPLDILISDNIAADAPEIHLSYGLDLHGVAPGTVTMTTDGGIDLNLGIETNLSTDVLPKLFADLVVHWDLSPDGTLPAPTISFNNVAISLGSVVDQLLGVFKPVLEFLNEFPFGAIMDALTEPLPLIDDIYQLTGGAIPFGGDLVPVGGNGAISLLDLVALYYEFQGQQSQADALAAFGTAITIVQQLATLAETGDDKIVLGDFSLEDGQPTGFAGAEDLRGTLNTLFGSSGAVDAILEGYKNLTKDGDSDNPLMTGLTDVSGLSFPLFENPEDVIKILLPDLTGNQKVTFVQYDLPELSARAQIGPFFFPVIGPIGITLSGEFGAGIDFAVGYDSLGFIEGGDFASGIFIKTAAIDDPATSEVETIHHEHPEPEHDHAFAPIGYAFAAVHAGVGVNAYVFEVAVEGGLLGEVDAFLPGNDGDLRLTGLLDGGCLFDPLEGTVSLDLSVRVSVGFSFFSWTHRFTIAEVTLVEFTFGCDGGESDENFSLASASPDAVLGPDLLLNVGDRAGHRSIGGIVGKRDDQVSYKIVNAVDENGNALAGVLTVTAFGIMENYGSAANPMLTIFADGARGNALGAGNDNLIVDSSVTQALVADGGGGDDRIQGGKGWDTLHGGSGFDILTGGEGDDHLYGGDQDDLLEGGAGADWVDGGSGIDQVTYEHSPQSVIFRYKNINGVNGFVGTGGEAEGDYLVNVEYIIGANVAGIGDELHGNKNDRNNLEGLAGNDLLVGGDYSDFLLGGAGGDTLLGGGGQDGTSYLTSYGGVIIDLKFHNATGGDAIGDFLDSIEDVQGSAWYDRILGTDAANVLDGWLGDDVLEGRGGADTMIGGEGNDIVYAGNDGDTLDGGNGVDLLSYERLLSAVTVSLRAGASAGGDSIVPYMVVDPISKQLMPLAGYGTFENLTGTNVASTGDHLTGDFGNNVIRGLAGNDYIDGEGGNDTLVGGSGADAMVGGLGFDLADYNDSVGGVYVTLTGAVGHDHDAEGDTLSGIENLRGSRSADRLYGDSLDNVIDPGLSTFGLVPTTFLPAYHDVSYGNAIDYVDGGGNGLYGDRLVVNYLINDYGQGLIGGYDWGSTGSGQFTRLNSNGTEVLDGVNFVGIENLTVTGTLRDDSINAGWGNDVIATGDGNDFISAGMGSDAVYADRGDDYVLYGTNTGQGFEADAGRNSVFFLDGGRGIDTLSISLAGLNENIVLEGRASNAEFSGVNLRLSNGAAIKNFEHLDDIVTGGGNDGISQAGYFSNAFYSGLGTDIVALGQGEDDYADGGSEFRDGVEIAVDQTSSESGVITHVSAEILDMAAFEANPGDLLILNYTDYQGSGGMIGEVYREESPHEYYIYYDYPFFVPRYTNYGYYYSADWSAEQSNYQQFSDFERLWVTGSSYDDLLVGTYGSNESGTLSVQATGRDILQGGGGGDLLVGNTGNDVLSGGAGNDVLVGGALGALVVTEYLSGQYQTAYFSASIDNVEVDTLTGGEGADTFVLGTADGVFYAGSSEDAAAENRAIITDFNVSESDVIQLNGNASNYHAVQDGPNTLIYYRYDHDQYDDNGNIVTIHDDLLIAEISNFAGFDFNADYVRYVYNEGVGGFHPGAEVEAQQRITAPPDSIAPLAVQSAAELAEAEAVEPGSWVTQTNNVSVLRDALFGGAAPTGLVEVGLEVDGEGTAFGTFDGDPFGLGSGIVLSTGDVRALDGPNLVDGGLYPPLVHNLTFEKVGTYLGSTIYRAALTGLGDINSIDLRDSGSFIGGSGGKYSGFDIDAIALSRTFLDEITSNPNDPSVLQKLDVFSFNNADMIFQPGSQRPGNYADPNMSGAVGLLVNNSFATLGTFDDSGLVDTPGSLSLGDNGRLSINLTRSVNADQPLYLYIAEAGISDETLAGSISVSSGRIEAPTDLSTDLGLPGAQDDTTSLTYKFTVAPGSNVNEVVFQFVMFSEELSEFAGSEFNDTFKIMLNGVNLARLSDGAAATVNSLQTAPFGPRNSDLILNPVGTGPAADETRADAYTKILTFAGAIDPTGVNILTIEVADVRDGLLDSGMLIKAGTLQGGYGGAGGGGGSGGGAGGGSGGLVIDTGILTTGAAPKVFEGGGAVSVPVLLLPALPGGLTAPVTITFQAGPDIDLGNGAGVPFSKTVNPGDDPAFELLIKAPDNHVMEGARFEAIHVIVESGDPAFDGLAVAPVVVEVDDPQQPLSSLTIADVTKTEGDAGFTEFEFTVTRTGGEDAISVDYTTVDGTATTASNDYEATSGTLNFAAGEMSKTVKVIVNGDIFVEDDENFLLNLLNPVGTTIADGQAAGTILSDEGASTRDLSAMGGNTTVTLTATGGQIMNTLTGKTVLPTGVSHVATGDGNDALTGNNNGNILNGGAGNDTIRGGAGSDVLIGGAGNDTLTSMAGNDTFVFELGFGRDVISDFSLGNEVNHDTLDLRGLGFASIADVLANTDTGASAVIHSGADTITLMRISKELLAQHQYDILI